MHLSEVLDPDRICIDGNCQSKTSVLLKISHILSHNETHLNSNDLFDAYCKREQLGSTAIGQGIMIPHIRCAEITKPKACFIKLASPIDFAAPDKQPVDLIIGLIVPKDHFEQHLQLLNGIVKQFNVPGFREQCRKTLNKEQLFKLICTDQLKIENL
ncbi:PTS sugar transporter subunit IIA [Legionella jordanis]|uniref:Nitrogen regulatory protein n=1 Tax=Legionella jordanis TaxID=456 RepID=A0A0W0VB77_9GAMM|nr:PTS sugar transporter subunit IIA [Legionella jordanis]KTD17358.1 Nitrogen regulatory protein [Legionella jordanis]RMX01874.1 PTS IIA-like nitrogen regulatory protein PtsN [Legionella jordanis]RMX17664.1 PTS IIA-like nitrogen regulatory protein PtsN [Legionella jordanis]VEH11625.1 Nitrogen regulatory protein [Legionella jordanis]